MRQHQGSVYAEMIGELAWLYLAVNMTLYSEERSISTCTGTLAASKISG
jgi:hypothetical protein